LKAVLGPDAVEDMDDITLLDILSRTTNKPIPPALAGLKDKEIRHKTVCKQSEMKDVLTNLFYLNEV